MAKCWALLRLLRAGYVMAREGVISALPREGLSGLPLFVHRLASLIAKRRARKTGRLTRIACALDRLGPTYIKLGQFLATRPDIVGADLAGDLALLHDQVSTFSRAAAIAQIEASLGRKINELYVEFGEPIAAASMAQVHPAVILDAQGQKRKVAVKVIRPGVRARFMRDLQGFFILARLQQRFIAATRRLRPVDIVENLAQTTRLELDLRLEAAALSELGQNIAKDEGFRVPEVDWVRTGRDVLTMEWIDGIKMSDEQALQQAGFDLNHLAVVLMQSFLRQTLRDGFFHADMHPGNLFVDNQGVIVAVDLGITGRLGRKEQHFLANILYGFIKRDYNLVARSHFEAGYVPSHHDVARFAQANRAIGEPIHGQSAETISMARLLSLLFEVTELFDMQTRPELLLLQKTMVVVEGVARTLDPNFNMWQASQPVVAEWIGKNLGPGGLIRDGIEGAQAVASLIRKLPEISRSLDEAGANLTEMAKNGLRLDEATLNVLAAQQARKSRLSRLSLIVIAACSLILTVKLLLDSAL